MGTILKFIFCILISINAMGMPSGWKLASDSDNVQVWLLKANTNVTASFEKTTSKRSLNWDKVKDESFFRKLAYKKKGVLSLIGVKDWKASKYKWNKKKQMLYLEGSYTDSSNQNIFFVEYHYYKKGETLQILHTRPASLKNGRKYQDEIIEHIKSKASLL